MSKPIVSVLIPVYNVEKYLERCLESLINQTLTQIEIVCVNDGSTDNSLKILEEYSKKDSRIVIVNKPNGGLPSARNAGLDVAKGKYVGFVDSDDYVQTDMFEKLYQTAEREKSDIVICGANIFPEETRATDWLYACLSPEYKHMEDFNADFLFFDQTVTPFLWRTLIRRDLIEENNLRLREDIMLGEDKAFQCKVYPLAKSITVIPDKLYNYFWCREDSLMSQMVYENPEKKIFGHGKMIAHIADTVKKYADKRNMKKDFLEWSIPFLYDDFICLALNRKIELAKKVLPAWESCGYNEYKYELPEWKREMVDYFEQVSEENPVDPVLSVIVPVDIEAEYIADMLQTLEAQSLKEMEIIIVNNGTKNENYAVLHKYLFQDKRVRLLNIAHGTYANALNKGIQLAEGTYMDFMETCDWYEDSEALHEWITQITVSRNDLCGCNYFCKNTPESVWGESRNTSGKSTVTEKMLESDFHSVIFNTNFVKENELKFEESNILTGFEFLAKACMKTDKMSWSDKNAYVHRKIYHQDWISTDKCKSVLKVLSELMASAKENGCGYLQFKILDMVNSDVLGKIILHNTRAFKGNPADFPEGENSQVEVIQCLMKILNNVDRELLKDSGYKIGSQYMKTLYEIIEERQKFLADMSN